jgi:ribosomal protein S18 acetylase RimI-like enzyme
VEHATALARSRRDSLSARSAGRGFLGWSKPTRRRSKPKRPPSVARLKFVDGLCEATSRGGRVPDEGWRKVDGALDEGCLGHPGGVRALFVAGRPWSWLGFAVVDGTLAFAGWPMNTTERPVARLATDRDVPEIVRICSEGWRDTYSGFKSAQYIEEMIAEFYVPERIANEIGAHGEAWQGYVVAELDHRLLVAGGGGLIQPTLGEVFVLYADPRPRRRGGGTAVLEFITEQHRRLGATEQWVSVEPENELGLSFYRAQRFVERGRRPAYRGDGESLRLSRPI